jgi:hypothetical protein
MFLLVGSKRRSDEPPGHLMDTSAGCVRASN